LVGLAVAVAVGVCVACPPRTSGPLVGVAERVLVEISVGLNVLVGTRVADWLGVTEAVRVAVGVDVSVTVSVG
jgi:hypothetical protein